MEVGKSRTLLKMRIKSTTVIFWMTLLMTSDVWAAASSPKGCFSSTVSMNLAGSQTFNSIGSCSTLCLGKKAEAMAMQDSDCYCGHTLPPVNSVTEDSKCSIPCPGYPADLCGGVGAYSVYLTGLSAAVSNAESSSSSSVPASTKPSSTSSASPSVVTVGGETVVVTANPTSKTNEDDSNNSSSSPPNKASIAAGVVVGLIIFTAMAGGLVLYLRSRKRRAIEEEHRQAAAVNSFIDGGKHSGSGTDTRLDPSVLANRRLSDGSIADNQDYSRRILKVINA